MAPTNDGPPTNDRRPRTARRPTDRPAAVHGARRRVGRAERVVERGQLLAHVHQRVLGGARCGGVTPPRFATGWCGVAVRDGRCDIAVRGGARQDGFLPPPFTTRRKPAQNCALRWKRDARPLRPTSRLPRHRRAAPRRLSSRDIALRRRRPRTRARLGLALRHHGRAEHARQRAGRRRADVRVGRAGRDGVVT